MIHDVIALDFFYVRYGTFVYCIHFTALYTHNMVMVVVFVRITKSIVFFPVKQLDTGEYAAFHHTFEVTVNAWETTFPKPVPEPGPGIIRSHMAVIVHKKFYYGSSQGS